jgi:hypothetical protein
MDVIQNSNASMPPRVDKAEGMLESVLIIYGHPPEGIQQISGRGMMKSLLTSVKWFASSAVSYLFHHHTSTPLHLLQHLWGSFAGGTTICGVLKS